MQECKSRGHDAFEIDQGDFFIVAKFHAFGPTWNFDALPEGISLVSSLATANGVVVVDEAVCVDSADSHAGVRAPLVDTGQVGGALWDNTRYNPLTSCCFSRNF